MLPTPEGMDLLDRAVELSLIAFSDALRRERNNSIAHKTVAHDKAALLQRSHVPPPSAQSRPTATSSGHHLEDTELFLKQFAGSEDELSISSFENSTGGADSSSEEENRDDDVKYVEGQKTARGRKRAKTGISASAGDASKKQKSVQHSLV